MCDSWGYGYAGALRVMLEGVPCLYAYGCVYVGAGVRRSCADDALAYGEVEEGFVYSSDNNDHWMTKDELLNFPLTQI